jgi:hypothetical protein
MRATYKVWMDIRYFLFVTCILGLPPSGGFIQLFDSSAQKTPTHYLCIIPYILIALWLWRLLERRIAIHDDRIEIVGWLGTRWYSREQVSDIRVLGIPKKDHRSAAFAVARPHLEIATAARTHIIAAEAIPRYESLKEKLTEFLGGPIEYVEYRKSVKFRIIERLTS